MLQSAIASLWDIDRIVLIPLATIHRKYSSTAERCVAELELHQPPGVIELLMLTPPVCYQPRSV
jgi:hypothetical protein